MDSGQGSGVIKRAGAVLNRQDWRQFAGAPAAPRALAPVRRRIDPLHLRSRPASVEVERDRAVEIVAQAKVAVGSAFESIRNGEKFERAALEPIVAAIAASVARNPTALPSVTRMKERHEYTYLHSIAVCALMLSLARELGLDAALQEEIGLAGLLHDVGKARVPVSILDKAGPLDLEEYALIQRHTTRGHQLLVESGIESDIALDVCLHHHERMDGDGYPLGISAQSISIYARMGAVCDVYDAVTSTRAYKRSWSPAEALEWMGGTAGQFDPRVLQRFRGLVGVFPLGALVRLQSDRLGIVLADTPEAALSPPVCAFFDCDRQRLLAPVRVDTARDPILSVEVAERWKIDDWSGLRLALLVRFGAGVA